MTVMMIQWCSCTTSSSGTFLAKVSQRIHTVSREECFTKSQGHEKAFVVSNAILDAIQFILNLRMILSMRIKTWVVTCFWVHVEG